MVTNTGGVLDDEDADDLEKSLALRKLFVHLLFIDLRLNYKNELKIWLFNALL